MPLLVFGRGVASAGPSVVDARLERLDETGERHDVEHALPVAHEVDDVVAAAGEHRRRALDHEARRREVLTEVVAQVVDRLARGLQRQATVEQALDHLQRDEVAVRVPTLRAAPLRVDERRAQQVGARPVVELAVGDADDAAHLGMKVSDATVYVVGYLEHTSSSAQTSMRMELSRFAQMTGGLALFSSSVKDVEKMYDKIEKEIAARYSLGYLSTDTRTDGTWRNVSIRLKRTDLKGAKLRTRDGYFALKK